MDDITKRPWWRWTPGMVVRVEGWGGRPVPQGVVVGHGSMVRVADEWGTTPRIEQLLAEGVRVVPDLDSAATMGCLFERLREVVQASHLRGPVVLYVDKQQSTVVIGDPDSDVSAHYRGGVSASSAIIVALDDRVVSDPTFRRELGAVLAPHRETLQALADAERQVDLALGRQAELYIKATYSVPADIGRRVEVDGRAGVIAGHRGMYIQVRFDDDPSSLHPCHPEWRVVYGDMCEAEEARKELREQLLDVFGVES